MDDADISILARVNYLSQIDALIARLKRTRTRVADELTRLRSAKYPEFSPSANLDRQDRS